jgi:hypothetical protein
MASKEIILSMSTSEEKSLSNLIGFLCNSEASDGMKNWLTMFLGEGSSDVENIGRINAALNARR